MKAIVPLRLLQFVLIFCPKICCFMSYALKKITVSSSCHQISNQRFDLRMKLYEISRRDASIILPNKITRTQWDSYWGVNKVERVQRALESLLLSYGGLWMAWFLSFMAGNFVASIVGSLCAFNWIYSPVLHAQKRNALVRSRNNQLYYSLYTGKISKLTKLRRRAGKSIGGVSQEFLCMFVIDEQERELEIITQWKSSYSDLRKGMSIRTVLVSPNSDMSTLRTVTDSWIPECDVWVGDYPYLSKQLFQEYVTQRIQTAQKMATNEVDVVEKLIPWSLETREKERYVVPSKLNREAEN